MKHGYRYAITHGIADGTLSRSEKHDGKAAAQARNDGVGRTVGTRTFAIGPGTGEGVVIYACRARKCVPDNDAVVDGGIVIENDGLSRVDFRVIRACRVSGPRGGFIRDGVRVRNVVRWRGSGIHDRDGGGYYVSAVPGMRRVRLGNGKVRFDDFDDVRGRGLGF